MSFSQDGEYKAAQTRALLQQRRTAVQAHTADSNTSAPAHPQAAPAPTHPRHGRGRRSHRRSTAPAAAAAAAATPAPHAAAACCAAPCTWQQTGAEGASGASHKMLWDISKSHMGPSSKLQTSLRCACCSPPQPLVLSNQWAVRLARSSRGLPLCVFVGRCHS